MRDEILKKEDEVKSKLTMFVGLSVIFMSMLMIAYVAYYKLRDFHPIDLYDANGELLQYNKKERSWYGLDIVNGDGTPHADNVIYHGETAFYRADFCRHTTARAVVEKHLVDGIFLQLNDPTEEDNIDTGGSFKKGCDGFNLPFYISPKIPVGKYRLQARVEYLYSPIHSEVRFFYTDPFEIKAQ